MVQIMKNLTKKYLYMKYLMKDTIKELKENKSI